MSTSKFSRRVQSLGVSVTFRALLVIAGACSKDSTSPAAATAISVTSGAAQTATVNTSLAAPVVITVADANGHPVPGVSVSFAPATSSGAVSSTQIVTDVNGAAQVSWTMGTVAGADSLTVTAAGLTPIAVVATATPDAAVSISVVAGNDQAAPAGTSLAAPLTVKVVDQFGNAVPNATVNWTDESGGSLGQLTSVTDKNGLATDALQIEATPGTDQVVATIVVSNSPVTAVFIEDAM